METNIKHEIVHFIWKIDNYSFISFEKGYNLHSSPFSSQNKKSTWHLSFAPNGVHESSSRYVAIKLGYQCLRPTCAKYMIEVYNENNDVPRYTGKLMSKTSRFKNIGMRGHSEWIEREILEHYMLDQDTLTIKCEITIIHKYIFKKLRPAPKLDLSSIELLRVDLEVLLDNAKTTHADLKLKFDDGELHAHLAILAARSQIFAELFENNKQEMLENGLQFEGISMAVGSIFLKFIYAGRIEFNDEHMRDVLDAALKYKVTNMKEFCLNLIACNLTDKNCIKYLIYSEMMNLNGLKSIIVNFIIENEEVILDTEEWQFLTIEYPKLVLYMYVQLNHFKTFGPTNPIDLESD